MEGGPVRVKCHSKRLFSRGAAVREGSGEMESSRDSWRMRLMVGDLVLKPGVRGVEGVLGVVGVEGMEVMVEVGMTWRFFQDWGDDDCVDGKWR